MTTERVEKPCTWCGEQILSTARICRFCQRHIEEAATKSTTSIAHPSNTASATSAEPTSFEYFEAWVSKELDVKKLAQVVCAIGVVCWIAKGAFGFSITNFTGLLFVPLGPTAIGFALLSVIPAMPDRGRRWWFAAVVALGAALFYGDQWIAFIYDNKEEYTSFISWYSDVVDGRGYFVRRGGSISDPGFNWFVEWIKLAAVSLPAVLTGWAYVREKFVRFKELMRT